MNASDRYQVIGYDRVNGVARGRHICTCKYIAEAREAVKGAKIIDAFIWDNKEEKAVQ